MKEFSVNKIQKANKTISYVYGSFIVTYTTTSPPHCALPPNSGGAGGGVEILEKSLPEVQKLFFWSGGVEWGRGNFVSMGKGRLHNFEVKIKIA